MKRLKLQLVIAGKTAASERALRNVQAACASEIADGCELEIIDILDERCDEPCGRVLATPTLVRLVPVPVRRVIGDLGDPRRLRIGLGLPPAGGLSS